MLKKRFLLKRTNPAFSRATPVILAACLQMFLAVPCTWSAETAVGAAPELAASSAVHEAPDSGNLTLDFKEAEINTVLRVMSIKSNINIVAGPEVKGTVTIRLENVPWEKALEVVLRTYGYVYERDGNIIRVTTRENLSSEPVVTQTYLMNYTKASEIQEAVKDMLTERGRIKVSERTNSLVITDIPTNLYHVGEIIKRLDKITPQAYIDSKVINTSVGLTENLGIQWNTGNSGNLGSVSGAARPLTFPFTTNPKTNQEQASTYLSQFFPVTSTASTVAQNTADTRSFPFVPLTTNSPSYNYGTLSFSSFSAVLQMLKQRADTKVVSNPRIIVLNNQPAKVQVGQQIPLPTFERNQQTGQVEVTGYSYRDIGVVLNVTPHINSQDEILVDLKPEVSSQGASINFTSFSIPSFNITQAVTQVLIRSGETIAIGGLLTDNTATTENKVPYLGDIPFVGKIFRSKRQDPVANTKVETLFFVTVTTVNPEGQPIQSMLTAAQPLNQAAAPQAPSGKNKVETSDRKATQSAADGTAGPNQAANAKPGVKTTLKTAKSQS